MQKTLPLKTWLVNFAIQHKYISMLVGFFFSWMAAALALFIVESGAAESDTYRSFGRSAWAIIVYLTSGLDEAAPASAPGKAISVVVLLLGIVLVGGITACITTDLVKVVLRGTQVPEKPRRLTLEEHIVVFGNNETTDRIIRELHHPILGGAVPIVIVTKQTDPIPISSPEAYRNVFCVRGNFSDSEVLRGADIGRARTAIILASEEGDQEAILTSLAVSSTSPETYTIVELQDPGNQRHLERTHADEIMFLDSTSLIAQCAFTHHASTVFEELLRVQKEGNEIYIVDVPKKIIGMNFADAAEHLMKEDAILIGIVNDRAAGREAGEPAGKRCPDISLNPEPDTIISAGERLALIARLRPDLGS
ncbi:MAG: NAD-binding protein [Planctomycetes bacterium]|nr:NAD-binding protein [Planctomycetota bacterium]